MKQDILVLCPMGIDAGLISRAAELGPVQALVPQSQQKEAAKYGATLVYTLEDHLKISDESDFALYLAERIRIRQPKIVLAPATIQMRGIMSALAWHLGAGLTADCTELSIENGRLLQTRPAFGNGLLAGIVTESVVTMATVRPCIFSPKERPCTAHVVHLSDYLGSACVECMEFCPFSNGTPLSQADLIIAGGLGIGSREGFCELERLSAKLGGAVAASRSAVDAGFAPYSAQVGMTGVTVSPKVYIAVGISGAVQHLVGMTGAETVIAVNSDPKAPIFDYADYGFVGDWKQVIPKLLEELL